MTKLLCTDTTLQDMYTNLAKLPSMAALLLISTAECELCFSTMNPIKTVLRNRVKTSTLDSLMRTSTDGPTLSHFNFERAADNWGSLHNRSLRVGLSPGSF